MASLAAAVATIMNDINVSPAQTQADRKKRYATYFPEKLAEVLASPYEDANSPWQFLATPVPCTSTPAYDNNWEELSPAQEIAYKYRRGSPAQQVVMKYRQRELSIVIEDVASARISSDSSGHGTLVEADGPAKDHDDASSIFEDATSRISAEEDKETSFIESDAPMLRHSISCGQLFDNAEEEAREEMEKAGASPEDTLVCPRVDCEDTIKNVRALRAHLTIHDIATRVEELYLVCHHCEARFASRQALGMHSCVGNTISPPSSPIVESFKQVLSVVTAFTL